MAKKDEKADAEPSKLAEGQGSVNLLERHLADHHGMSPQQIATWTKKVRNGG